MLTRRRLLGLLLFVALAAAVLGIWPQLDLAVSALAFDLAARTFPAAHAPALRLLREVLRFLPHLIAAPAIGVVVAAALVPRWRARLPLRPALFLAATYVIGPGLLVNGLLKEQWDRPRPVEVREFGGPAAFHPWWRPGGACRRNCSFVSGEAASSAWTLGAAALTPPPVRAAVMGVAAGYAATTAALRVAFGAHFLSDVLLGATLSLLVVWLGWRWLRPAMPELGSEKPR